MRAVRLALDSMSVQCARSRPVPSLAYMRFTSPPRFSQQKRSFANNLLNNDTQQVGPEYKVCACVSRTFALSLILAYPLPSSSHSLQIQFPRDGTIVQSTELPFREKERAHW